MISALKTSFLKNETNTKRFVNGLSCLYNGLLSAQVSSLCEGRDIAGICLYATDLIIDWI